MEKFKSAMAAGDQLGAARELVSYFKNSSGWQDVYRSAAGSPSREKADNILKDVYTFQNATDTVGRNADGGIVWTHCGEKDDLQYAMFLNRHQDWPDLLQVYKNTGQAKYGRKLDELIRDWLVHNPAPDSESKSPMWRPINAGLRMGFSWPQVFYGFVGTDSFSDAGILLMLAGFAEHGEYLRQFKWKHHNHASMELLGLGHVALAFPEFKKSSIWYDVAVAGVLEEMDYQFYPDGVQKELTAHYHRVSLVQFDKFADLCHLTGKKVNPLVQAKREAAWNYLAWSLRPLGNSPLNNDSDLDYNAPNILAMAGEFDRPDWEYIASNGAGGVLPEQGPSKIFPWAGQLVSRSGWDAYAHWSFFDIGPWGISHQHDDKLHLSVSAFGRDILVDSGRHHYITEPWTRLPYFTESRSHNVILIDGKGQSPDVTSYTQPFDNYYLGEQLDFAMQDTGSLFEGAVHKRAVVYIRGKYWLVVDRIETASPRKIEALWHFHPDCTVVADGMAAVSTDAGKGNIRLKPVGENGWDFKLVKGQAEPQKQGWYSDDYNMQYESTCASYSLDIDGGETFAWLICPARGEVADPSVEVIHNRGGVLQLRIDDGDAIEIAVDMRKSPKPVTLTGGESFIGRCAVSGLAENLVAAKAAILSKDNRAPSPVAIKASSAREIVIDFDEYVNPASALDTSNYAIDHGISIHSVKMGDDGRSVLLGVSGLSKGVDCTVKISGVGDFAHEPNIMQPIEMVFTYAECISSSKYWQSFGLAEQGGSFDVEFDVVPLSNYCDAVITLSKSPAQKYSDNAVLVRFNDSGRIDVRDGSGFRSEAKFAYAAGRKYHLRASVDIPAGTYSVFVRSDDQKEITLANNYSFRTEQKDIKSINTWNLLNTLGLLEVYDFTLHAAE